MGFCIEGGGSIALISPCVVDILRTAFSALFVFVFLHRSYQLHFSADTYNSFAYEETDMIFKFKYVFFIVSCILAVLSIAFAFDDTGNRSSVALLLTSLMVALAHASSALCMRLEAKKNESWPSLHLKFYYSISFALNLLDCAVNYSSTLDFIESVVSTFLALILVVSFVIKDVFFIDYATENDQDSHKDQRSFPNDVRYSSLIEKEENGEENDAFERSRSDERFSFSGSLDYFRLKLKSFTSPPHNPNSSSLNDSSHNPYLEDLLLAESGQERENSFSSSRSASNAKTNSRTLTYSSSGPPVVLSALDKSLVSTDYSSNQSTPVKSPLSSDSRRDRTPKAGTNSSSNSSSNNSINNNSNNSPSSPSRNSANSGSGGSNKLDSGALQRALLLQKSKQQLQQNLPSESSLNKTNLKSINTADSHVASSSNNTSPSSSSGDLLVSVHRWGIRRKNEGSNNSNSNCNSSSNISNNSNRSSMGALTKPKSPLKNASNTTFDADDDDYDDEFDAGEASLDLFGGTVASPAGSHNGHTEVEFEICVALGSNSGYSMPQDEKRSSNLSASSSFIGNTSMKMSEQEWWGLGRTNGDQEGVRSSAFNSSSSKKTNGGKWVVWKTSGDVISLHVSLVNLLGDAAPKRPKLKSAMPSLDGLNSGSANISMSRHELSDDMRSISFYLNNLLRGLLSNGTHAGLQLIYSFLKINNPDYLQSQSSANLPGSFQLTDNISIDKKSLKGNDSDVSQNETSLFSIEAAKVENQSIHQRQEKWRKLFVSMRMALKPGEITVKCRLFEGVVSGESIAAWLMSPDSKMGTTSSNTNTATTSSSSTADIATRSNNIRTVQDACAIAQELLICGLLVPVSYGYLDDGAQFSDPSFNYSSALVVDTSLPTSLQQQPPPPFFYLYGYIYRFGEKAGSSSIGGSRIQCTVFGAPCLVRISEWSHAESSDDINEGIGGGGGRDSVNMGRQSEVFMVNSSGKEAKGHIEYLVQASHGGDSWRTWKRYREFEQLQRGLMREGIDITASLPSKTMGRSINNHTIIESRRVGLETFLKSALDAAIRSGSLEAMQICALFLDEDHKKLRSYSTES